MNKVLGREVYSSNLQLGGTQIMHRNGVSHLTARNDFDGISKMLTWLSYIPKERNTFLPIIPSIDPVNRMIDFTPIKGGYDVRHMLSGTLNEDSSAWISGFFDRDSVQETMSAWARTVVRYQFMLLLQSNLLLCR